MFARRNVLSLAFVCASLTACPPDPVAAPPPPGDAATVDQSSPPPADVQTPGDDAAAPPPTDVVSVTPMDASTPPPMDVTPPTDVAAPPTDRGAQPRDYSRTGPYTVAMWTGTVQGTQGNARAFYPMTSGAERFPLVVFAHGFQLALNNYDRLLVHVASWGYGVLSVDYPGNLRMVDHRNVSSALTAGRRAFTTGSGTAFPALARVDTSRAVAMGQMVASLTERGSSGTASMFRDMTNLRPTEHEHIIADMLARARAAGVPAPLLRISAAHLQAYEAMRTHVAA